MKPITPNTLLQNRYLIVQLIGKGGMGEVYLAVDQRLGSAVAIKRTFFSDDESLGNAFEREAKILARLRHSVLPKVSDHFAENDLQYLVMEHISGDDLGKRLEVNKKPFPLSWVLFWADQLLDALSYLHKNDPPIIHRDIKPQNLKLTADHNIVLLDFGLSKNTVGQTRTSTSGSVVGYTPHYAPMEQIRGTGTTGKSDIFSLSATLYQLLTNVVPADALTRADALLSGMKDPIDPISNLNPDVPEKISAVILKGMKIAQDQRHASAGEMQKALREAYLEIKSHPADNIVSINTSIKEKTVAEEMTAETPAGVLRSQLATEVISYPTRDEYMTKADSVSPPSTADQEAVISRQRDSQTSESVRRTDQESDFEATLRLDGEPKANEPKQSDIQTEVFSAGSLPFVDEYQNINPNGAAEVSPVKSFTREDDLQLISNNDSENLIVFEAANSDPDLNPEAIVPMINFAGEPLDALPANSSEFKSDLGPKQKAHFENKEREYDQSALPFAHAANETIDKNLGDQSVSHSISNTKTSLMIAGGIGAVILLIIGVAGLGWILLSGTNSPRESQSAAPAPTAISNATSPSPQQLKLETALENSAAEPENETVKPDTEIVSQTPPQTKQSSPIKTRSSSDPAPRSTPPIAAIKNPAAEKTPLPKKTPVKSKRTDILQ